MCCSLSVISDLLFANVFGANRYKNPKATKTKKANERINSVIRLTAFTKQLLLLIFIYNHFDKLSIYIISTLYRNYLGVSSFRINGIVFDF